MSQIDLQWFAAEDEGRTEDPTDEKLRKARKEGRVAKSQELNGNLVLFFCIILMLFLASFIERKCEEVLIYFFNHSTEEKIDNIKYAYTSLRYFLIIVLPFTAIGFLAAVVSNIIQNKGWLYTTKTIEPKFNKVLPHFGQYLKRTIFSFEGVFNILKSIIKVAIIVFIAFLVIKFNLPKIFDTLKVGGPRLAMNTFASMAALMLIICSLLLVVVGVLDYIVQRRQFKESMKMTKQEVKEEFKELEGDPEVKSHLEGAQKALLQQNIHRAVKEADVLITNPTHFAVALEWKRDTKDFPEITAKGEDLTAQNMKRIARENDVPIVENRPLARGLYADCQVGDIIPESYIKAIVTVYVQIGYMNKKSKKI